MEKSLYDGLGVPMARHTAEQAARARVAASDTSSSTPLDAADSAGDVVSATELLDLSESDQPDAPVPVPVPVPVRLADPVDVPGAAVAADPDPFDPQVLMAAAAKKNAWWRAPLLTASICVGKIPEGGPYFGGSKEEGGRLGSGNGLKGDELTAAVAEVKHAADPPKLPIPICVLASTADRVWPYPMPQRWSEVAGDGAHHAGFMLLEVGRLSHFKMMVSDEVREAVTLELAKAAAAQVAVSGGFSPS